MIKVVRSLKTEQIMADTIENEGEIVNTLSNTTSNTTLIVLTTPTPISLTSNN